MKLIDVSVPLDEHLPTYPNNTPFTVEPIKRVARGDSSNVSTLHLSAHAGTHVDAPRHFFDEGVGADALPLEMLVGRTRVIEISGRKGITADDLLPIDLSEDVRVLIKKGEEKKVQVEINVPDRVPAPVKAGQMVGEIVVKFDGAEVGKTAAAAAQDVAQASLWKRWWPF